jgi:hypothetical protein
MGSPELLFRFFLLQYFLYGAKIRLTCRFFRCYTFDTDSSVNFTQKQIDNYVQRIKGEALSGNGFREGENRERRIPMKATKEDDLSSPQSIERMQNELLYLRQEVEYLKKIIIADNSKRK